MSKKTQKNETNEGKIIETKEQKFVRIVEKRVNVALDKLRLIKNVFGSKSYSMTEEQFNKVNETLLSAVSDIDAAYSGRTKSKNETPKFKI